MRKKKNAKANEKLSYYSIKGHKAILTIYALLTLILSILFFVALLRFCFWMFGLVSILRVGLNQDVSYLVNFLGGLIGVVVGFFADAIFISRLQHLKKYKSLLNLLNKELNDVKNTIKYIWGVETLLNNQNIINILKKSRLLTDNGEIESLENISKFNNYLMQYSPEEKDFYNSLFQALKCVFKDKEVINEIRKNTKNFNLQGFNKNINLYELINHFTEHSEENFNYQILSSALSLCLALNANNITKISAPILENIVCSPEGIATFYNLPRYTFWSEEQGNFAKELQFFYHSIKTFENNFNTKKSWEFLLICKDLIDRIDKFQKVTDREYFNSDICDYLKSLAIEYYGQEVFDNENMLTEEDFIKYLVKKDYLGLRVKKLKRLTRFENCTINRNYVRYELKLSLINKLLPDGKSTRKYKKGYLEDDHHNILRKKFILKFEKDKYLLQNTAEYSLKNLLTENYKAYDTQSVISMTSIHNYEHSHNYDLSDFAFSTRYFSSGIKKFINETVKTEINEETADKCLQALKLKSYIINEKIEIISRIFKDITTIRPRKFDDIVETQQKGELTALGKDSLGKTINKIIISSYNQGMNKSETILKIISPIGSYKNRLLQYIYLKLKTLKKQKFPVFYLDISKYENEFDSNSIYSDFDTIYEIINDYYPDKNYSPAPLIILDNVREFHCGINEVYSQINDFLKFRIKSYKLIVGCDALYTLNSDQQYKLPFQRVKSVINIASMNISREKESIDFIKNCLLLNDKSITDVKAIESREKLIKLNFYMLDAYWLLKILKQTKNFTTDSINILYLYDYGLFKYTIDKGKVWYDKLAESVYAFEYESQHFDTTQLCSNKWKLAREHRSMIDYLVARHYVILLRETILPKDEYTIIQNLGSKLNLFLPKSVNRFIVHELSNNDIQNLIFFCMRNIEIIKNYPKFECQVAYILGEKGGEYLVDAKKVLQEIKKHLPIVVKTDSEIKQKVFTQRCIAMGLGRLGDNISFSKYLKTIIPSHQKYNIVADDVNRAFHLDYYGDTNKCLNLNSSFSDYSDDISKGVNTFRKLQIDMSEKIDRYVELDNGRKNIFMLQMITYCSLIKARNYNFDSSTKDEEFLNHILNDIKSLSVKTEHIVDAWFHKRSNNYIIEFLINFFSDAAKKVANK